MLVEPVGTNELAEGLPGYQADAVRDCFEYEDFARKLGNLNEHGDVVKLRPGDGPEDLALDHGVAEQHDVPSLAPRDEVFLVDEFESGLFIALVELALIAHLGNIAAKLWIGCICCAEITHFINIIIYCQL